VKSLRSPGCWLWHWVAWKRIKSSRKVVTGGYTFPHRQGSFRRGLPRSVLCGRPIRERKQVAARSSVPAVADSSGFAASPPFVDKSGKTSSASGILARAMARVTGFPRAREVRGNSAPCPPLLTHSAMLSGSTALCPSAGSNFHRKLSFGSSLPRKGWTS